MKIIKCNISGIDRAIRIILGIILLIIGIKTTILGLKLIFLIIFISLLFSGISGFCLLYKIFKISTCKIKE